ncbi:MAG TPA: DAK2 domain-containing protein [Microlunatus sp.]
MSSAVTSGGGVGSLAPPEIWRLCLTWLERSAEVITASAAGLDAINVFPVADSDTGTNLQQTLTGIIAYLSDETVEDDWTAELVADGVVAPTPGSAAREDDPSPADLVVRAAVLSAHGNSGAIVAEMIISLSRALERSGLIVPREPERGLALVLRTVATAGRRAVARPVEGTILTVAAAAAAAAEQAVSDGVADRVAGDPAVGVSRVLAVAEVARAAAAEALRRTPDELARLAEAGVVDAGGQAYVLLLDVLVEILGGPVAVPLPEQPPATRRSSLSSEAAPPAYEVMYALRGTGIDDLDALRERLSVLGDSVVVVGDRTVAQVHVHLTDAGAAVEAGLACGRLSQIRITVLPPSAASTVDERAVVAVVAGQGLADAVGALGGTAVLPTGSHVSAEELTSALQQSCGDVIVLPNDMECLEIASHLANQLRAQGRRVAVIPTVAQVQGLAALAVHEPDADFDSVVVAMSSTAGHARHAAVTVAESPAMTMAGRCEVGDVLGLVDGDFVEIGDDLAEVTWRVIERLLSSGGGELLTLVRGQGADDRLIGLLRARIRAWSPSLDVELIDGGQARYPLLVGLE